ncbi:DUF5412 domain-containing protein [Paenibacillus sp. KR2-11]|uniref:DUF5412 domain-containing protein n=1 Tax=Paenibacillus sp. KR2-11 TaxID=3385500 RepID=UPI0038FCC20A
MTDIGWNDDKSSQEAKKIKRNVLLVILVISLFVLSLLSYAFYYFIYSTNHLPQGELILESHSPGGTYIIKAYRVNGGATTGYAVRAEMIKNSNGKLEGPKNMYWEYREDRAEIQWLDEDTVIINNRTLHLPGDSFDFRRKGVQE